MQLGVTDHVWTVSELIEAALDGVTPEPRGRRVGRFTVIEGGQGVTLPRRIAVIGISGSGKTTFARKLAKAFNLPLYHADSIEWAPNWQVRAESEIFRTYESWIGHSEWLIEGWIDPQRADRLSAADLVIDLDYSRWCCAWRELNRVGSR
jgi:hypothetical protein